ncbi:hypothetical protein, partial [Halomicronema sp. CCY15110]|uniref:hypothetical protein n=1 Tax=Halomicronema sp. CCY15110 TaxID=2767773 RepID=UPI001951EF3C
CLPLRRFPASLPHNKLIGYWVEQLPIFNKSAAALPIPETVFPYTVLRLISYMRCIAQENCYG